MCHRQLPFLMTLLVLVTITALATCEALQAADATVNKDKQILLKEQAWVEAYQWDSNTSPCDWFGVLCQDSQVTTLYLCPYSHPSWDQIADNYRVSKAAPLVFPDSWSELTQLGALVYCYNSIPVVGQLPSLWTKLVFIHISSTPLLTGSTLTVTLPEGQQRRTQDAPFASWSLNGSLPDAWGSNSNLSSLILEGHTFQGPIPPSWGNMSNLRGLYVSNCTLSGTLPGSLGNLARLQTLDLSGNDHEFSGSLPEAWGGLTQLQTLNLSRYNLTGTIPSTWGNMSNLTRLDVSGCRLTGTLPGELGKLAQLRWLNVSDNQLSGSLPEAWGGLTLLQTLNLSHYNLIGPIPPTWGNMTNLTRLDLSGCNLTGTLPGELGKLTQLRLFNVSNNQLSGSLPETWGTMTYLHTLDLSTNLLTGVIPTVWGQMFVRLDGLNLSNNKLAQPFQEFWEGISTLAMTGLGTTIEATSPADGTSYNFTPSRYSSIGNYQGNWEMHGVSYCPHSSLSQFYERYPYLCRRDRFTMTIDKATWEHCNREPLLEACVSECIGLYYDYPDLCVVKHAGLTLSLLWCTLVGLLSIIFCAYIVVRIKLIRHDPSDNSRFTHLMKKAKQGWARALQWRPWGVKAAALFGLATFWYDKGSDVKLLSDVWGHTWTGYALLVFLLYQYVLQGYILIFHIVRAHKFTRLFEARLFRILRFKRALYFAFMLCPVTGVLVMIGLDVCLFVSDLGYSAPFVDRHFDLEEYQLFRDIGRALFGTVPTAILQSVTFTTGSTPQNGLVLTTQTFVSAIVASGLQLVKVTGELMYLALQGKAGMHTVFWRLLVGKHVVREALETKSSDLLPQDQIISSQPDI